MYTRLSKRRMSAESISQGELVAPTFLKQQKREKRQSEL
jgi:hypothetical protein